MTFFGAALKSHFNKAGLAAALLLCAASARAGLVHERMEQMEAHMEAVEAAVKHGGSMQAALPHAAAMVAAFEELDKDPNRYSADPMWHRWLSDSAAAARRLQAALAAAAPDLKGAAAELHAIDALREQAHAHFRPGLLGRLERWLMEKKRHHETTPPPAVPPLAVGAGAQAGLRAR